MQIFHELFIDHKEHCATITHHGMDVADLQVQTLTSLKNVDDVQRVEVIRYLACSGTENVGWITKRNQDTTDTGRLQIALVTEEEGGVQTKFIRFRMLRQVSQ